VNWRDLARCCECKENPVDPEYPICRLCSRARRQMTKRIQAICIRRSLPFEDARRVVCWNDAFRDSFLE
jgi:hypothetical protein